MFCVPLDFARGPGSSNEIMTSAPLGRRRRSPSGAEVPTSAKHPVPERSRGLVPERSRGPVPERSRWLVPERSRGPCYCDTSVIGSKNALYTLRIFF